ncbi:barstar family protein [Deinococcus sp.]|uniref:barstar family protein n=1 Tax=Deinococcus sp. TaxID=47478 RepID=UPI0025BCDF1A|nr:barstar family protein [Deinococcus sp.]
MTLFHTAPDGLQPAPHDARALAAGQQITTHEVQLAQVEDKGSLMTALVAGLGLRPTFGHNWDALYDVLTDPAEFPDKSAILLRHHEPFRQRHPRLCEQLEGVLLDAQAENREQGRQLWLLTDTPS